MENLSYPVGKFERPKSVTEADRSQWIGEIATLPEQLRQAVDGLSGQQLDTPYRPDGWTVRQVVHHLADSHLNAFTRLRLTLTEESPTIRAYDQDAWANLSDSKSSPVEASLRLLEGLHERWVALARGLSTAEFRRTFYHPELADQLSIDTLLAMYAWHGRHHVAHITKLRDREGF